MGDPVPTDPTRGYFEADRVAPLAQPGDWRALWMTPEGAVGVFTGGSDGS